MALKRSRKLGLTRLKSPSLPSFRDLAAPWRLLRRYPIIPVAIIAVVMVIPAIFAPLIAPHPPKRGVLTDRLMPPFWMSAKVLSIEVVDTIDPIDYRPQILTDIAQSKVDGGGARILGGGLDVKLGDKIVEIKTIVDRISSKDSANQILLEDAKTAVIHSRQRTVSGGEVAVGEQVEPISARGGQWNHLLGTDKVGRDILSRIIYGSRISVVVAGIAVLLSGTVGTALGIAAGFYGRWVDAVVMRMVDISLSIPIILLALVLVSAVGASFGTVVTVLVLLLWAHYARLSRGVTLSIKSADFIARAQVSGASDVRIMIHHILPNVVNSLVVLATLQVGFVIIIESTLSFLGAGIPRPNPAWGLMVADGRDLIISHWWVSFFPGIAIMLVVLSMNLLGDWLRDKLDPKQRQMS